MSTTIDDRVVAMSFDNSKFQSGVSTTMSSLDKLKQALHFPNAGKGLANVDAAAKKVNLGHISDAIDGISSRFSALSVVAVSVLANIANKAVMAGASLAKSLTISPVMEGFREYETKLTSVQTILANTQASGATLKDVNATLQELNQYADQTIYNFGQMAKNIGTFTAAGVDLETATASIKGIANLAALSGSNSEQASTAMYQLSQAISAGRVGLQDWNSVVNAGMGGTVFQRALAQTAEKMGTLSKGSVELKGKMKNVSIEGESFRNSIMAKPGEESWLTSEVLTSTLKQFTGDMSDAELKAQGFTKAQIKSIQAQAATAKAAATEVKTLSGLMDTTKESIVSGWAETWEIVFGDFEEAKTLFTGISEAIGGFVKTTSDARNSVLEDWKELGGRQILISGIKAGFQGLISIVKPIKEAFRDIFPAKTGDDLVKITYAFHQFLSSIKIGPETAENLKRTFKGLFAVLDIGKGILSGIGTVVKTVFKALSGGGGGFLEFTGSIGDNLVILRDWLREGYRLHDFFVGVGEVIADFIGWIGDLSGKLVSFWDSLSGGDLETTRQGLGDMTAKLKPMEKLIETLSKGWDGFLEIFNKVKTKIGPALDAIATEFNKFGDLIVAAFTGTNFDAAFSALETGLIAGIFLVIKKAFGGGLKLDIGAGVLGDMSNAFKAVTGNLEAMQKNIQANTLLKIAGAMAILTISIVALSKVDAEDLAKAMTAITIGFGQLVAVMALLNAASGGTGFAKMASVAGSFILLAIALNILALAVKQLSGMSWGELAKGLTAIGALLVMLSIAVLPLSQGSGKLILTSVGLIAVGIALNILALAVKSFGDMDWSTIGKGIIAMALALGAIGIAVSAIPPSILLIGPGLIAVGVALNAIAAAVLIFGSMSLGDLMKGLLGLAAGLDAIAIAINLMPPHMIIQAAGLVLVGVALNMIAGAVAIMGNLSLGTLAKGILAIGAVLLVLAVGLTAMVASLPGAAALLVAAAALAILAPVIGLMGQMSWGTIIKGLTALGAAMLVIGITGVVAAPALIALGAALIVIGAGLVVVGTGAKLIAQALSLMSKEGTKGVAVLIAALSGLILIVPKLVIDFLKGILAIIKGITEIAPLIVESFGKILIMLLDIIIKAAPKMQEGALVLIQAFLTVLRDSVPDLIETGLKLLTAFLTGVNDNVSKLTKLAGDIIIKFLTSLTAKLPGITRAGADALAALLRGIANNIQKVVTQAAEVVAKFIRGIANNIGKVATAGGEMIGSLIKGIAKFYAKVISAGVDAVLKLLSGIASKFPDVVNKGVEIAGKFINAVAKGLVKLADTGATAIINFLNGIAAVIRTREPEMFAAGRNIGSAIIEGFVQGINLRDIAGAIANKLRGAVEAAKRAVDARSPSRVFMEIGDNVMQGFAIGIESNQDANKAIASMSYSIINGVKDIFEITSPSKVMQKLGEYVGEGFREGLLGSEDDIDAAFESMKDKMLDAMVSLREEIGREEDKRDNLLKIKKKDKDDKKKIKEAQDNIKRAEAELKNTKNAHTELVRVFKAESAELKKLSDDYDTNAEKLEKANDDLEQAIKDRDDFFKDTSRSFGALPDINQERKDQLGQYKKDLTAKIAATNKYKATLDQLLAMGLDDETYRMLLEEGTAGQKFADQLVAGGPAAVASIGALSGQLTTASQALGAKAASELYDAGVQSAQALVNSLKAEEGRIYEAMKKIAEKMIKAIKDKLKIKSPSRVMAELGKLSARGMAEGLAKSSKVVSDSAVQVTEDAIAAMKKSVSELAFADTEMDPTITPVLDLTQLQRDARAMSDMLNVVPITAAASYGQAAAISSDQNAIQTAFEEAKARDASVIKFEQNNYSPKALSNVEIYRQTKNQINQVKAALT